MVTKTGSLAKTSVALACAALTMLGAAGVAACGGQGGAQSPRPDPVVTTVAGQTVRQSAVAAAAAELRLSGGKGDAAAALREAIDGSLVRAEAQRLGVSARVADVQKRRALLERQLGGAAALAQLLAKAHATDAQLQEALAAAALSEAVQNAKFPSLKPTAAQVRAFYDRRRGELFTRPAAVDLSALVVKAEKIAESAIGRLHQGRPFAEVARQFSVDPQLKDASGRMGWTLLASLPPSLRRGVEKLPVGKVSPPLPATGGWWVFEVLGRRDTKVTPFVQARAAIVTELTREKRAAALARWLAAARKASGVSPAPAP